MATYTMQTIKQDSSSRDALISIFDPKNKEACENYGGGTHCNTTRVEKKVQIWGARGNDAKENDCMVAKIIFSDDKPVALFNIGKSGTPPTIIDKTKDKDGSVYEFSGLMVIDEYFHNGLNTDISATVKNFINSCDASPNYTKAFVTFSPTHPYQKDFLGEAGGEILTEKNLAKLLGDNSFHPARFKFENSQFYECSKYDQSVEPIEYDNWHPSNPCAEWAEKTAMVFNVSSDHHITPIHEDL